MQTMPMWIELDGAVNARDVGGLPLSTGGHTNPRRLLRSDNLQHLTVRDIRLLVDDYGLRSVVDLRTDVEVTSEGPAPLDSEPHVQFLRASLFVEYREATDLVDTDDGPVVLPWHGRAAENGPRTAAGVYLRYLTERPDSIVAGLRHIGHSDGATLVHCAAGKDRTGVLIALALDAVGVYREAIVADFARTADRLPELLKRLAASSTYAKDITVDQPDRHHPRASTMEQFLASVDAEHGGTATWLATNGWTDEDQRALRSKLTAIPD